MSKKVLLVSIWETWGEISWKWRAAILGVVIGLPLFFYLTYSIPRWWNWNVGGYGARAKATSHTAVCQMVNREAIKPKLYNKYCK